MPRAGWGSSFDDSGGAEVDIEVLTQDITRLFRKCEGRLQQFGAGTSCSDGRSPAGPGRRRAPGPLSLPDPPIHIFLWLSRTSRTQVAQASVLSLSFFGSVTRRACDFFFFFSYIAGDGTHVSMLRQLLEGRSDASNAPGELSARLACKHSACPGCGNCLHLHLRRARRVPAWQVKQNVQRTLATELQKLSLAFRKQRKAYLTKLRGAGEAEWAAHAGDRAAEALARVPQAADGVPDQAARRR